MRFPEYLRHLLTSRRLNVSDAARIIRVERSTLSRAVNGTRLPKWNVISQLSDCLQLTPDEARRLHALYNEAAMGEDAYRILERVKELIMSLCRFNRFAWEDQASIVRTGTASDPYDGIGGALIKSGFITGSASIEMAISALVREEAQAESGIVEMMMPADNKALLSRLTRECHQIGGIKIEHLVNYVVTRDESGADVLNGLDILEYALQMMMSYGSDYHPYFLYSDSAHSSDALPNLIVTGKRLMRISSDYTCAEISSNPNAVQYYRSHIQKLKSVCRPFIKFQFDPMQMMLDYSKVNANVACQTIMNHPCTGQYITEEIIESAVYEDLPEREAICKMAAQYFAGMAQSSARNTTFFTRTGVRDFLKTGVISDVPSGVSRPLSPEHRREIIRRFTDDVRKGRISAWLIDETMLSIPPNLTIGTSEYPVGVFFSKQMAEQKTPYFSIVVMERIIAQALYDFMMYLPSSNFVLDKQETLNCLQQCLEEDG